MPAAETRHRSRRPFVILALLLGAAAVAAYLLLRPAPPGGGPGRPVTDLPARATTGATHLGRIDPSLPLPAGPVPTARVETPEEYHVARTVEADCRANLARPGAVLLIGDSLTVGSAEAVSASLAAAGVPVCLDARSGRNAGEGNTVLRTFLDRRLLREDTLVVMAFGANDTAQPAGWGTCQATTALAAVGPGRAVVWVNGYNRMDQAAAAGQARFNAEIQQLAVQVPRLGVIDWQDSAATGDGYIGPDQVHPSEEGAKAWTQLVTTGVTQARTALSTGQTVVPRCQPLHTGGYRP